MVREESREDFAERAASVRTALKECREAGDTDGVRVLNGTLTTICGQAEEWASRNG